MVCPRSDSGSVTELARGLGYLHTTLMVFFLPRVTSAHYSSKSMDWLSVRAHMVAEIGRQGTVLD